MERKLALLLILGTVMAAQSSVSAADGVSVSVNGEKLDFTGDQAPVIVEGRTLVPFRAVLEKMGADVKWYGDTKTITCTLGDNMVSLAIGSEKMLTSSPEPVVLDVPAQVIGSRTMVPIRAISDGLGAHVDWDGVTKSVSITTDNTADAPEEEEVPPDYIVDTKQEEGYTVNNANSVFTANNIKYTVNISYPVLDGTKLPIKKINSDIDALIKQDIAQSEELFDRQAADMPDEDGLVREWSDDISYEIAELNDEIVSIVKVDSIYLGGAHPSTSVTGFTYDITRGTKLNASDFVDDALDKAEDGVKEMVAEDPDSYPFYDEETFRFTNDDFYVSDGKLVFVIQQYAIAPYAAGIMEYTMDIDTKAGTLKNWEY